jgi:hypothetical protein
VKLSAKNPSFINLVFDAKKLFFAKKSEFAGRKMKKEPEKIAK